MLKSVNHLQPAYAIFENVIGLLRYINKFADLMKELEGCLILDFRLSPTDLGHSVRRPRVYMIALRRDLLLSQDVDKVCSLGRSVLSTLQSENMKVPLKDRLLPDHHLLRESVENNTKKGKAGKGEKWKKLHKQYKKGIPKCDLPLTAEMKSLTPREQDIVSVKWRQSQGDSSLVLDVSQSINRCPQGSTEGECPCVIPGAKIYSISLDRVITPNELLLLHGIPIHRLRMPDLGQSDLASLVGNCMHVECVTAATLVALSCLQCEKLVSASIQPSDCSRVKKEPGEMVCMELPTVSADASKPRKRPAAKGSRKPAAAESHVAEAATKKPAANEEDVCPKKLRRSGSGFGKRMALTRAYSDID